MTLYSTLFLKPSLRLTRAVGKSENLKGQIEPSCCKKRQKSPNQETILGIGDVCMF